MSYLEDNVEITFSEINNIRELEVEFEMICGYSKEEATIAAMKVIEEDNKNI